VSWVPILIWGMSGYDCSCFPAAGREDVDNLNLICRGPRQMNINRSASGSASVLSV